MEQLVIVLADRITWSIGTTCWLQEKKALQSRPLACRIRHTSYSFRVTGANEPMCAVYVIARGLQPGILADLVLSGVLTHATNHHLACQATRRSQMGNELQGFTRVSLYKGYKGVGLQPKTLADRLLMGHMCAPDMCICNRMPACGVHSFGVTGASVCSP
eukprot:1148702-Pelagomonas_calceolata.AAC.1